MSQRILPRVPPSRCKGKYYDGILTDPDWFAEEKLDGGRYELYFDYDQVCRMHSRLDFPRIEKAANVPHISRFDPRFTGTVLDGEIRLPQGQFLTDTTGIMNMTPENARATQMELVQHGLSPLTYVVFDVIYLNGRDMRGYKYVDRRAILERLVHSLGNPYIRIVEITRDDKAGFYNRIVEAGGEGIILKHRDSAYGEYWVKRKKFTDVTVIITDFKQGNYGKTGRLANTLGALVLSVYHQGELLEIGNAGSGFDDALRDTIWNNRENYMNRCVDVRSQEMTSQGRLREPRFWRFRDDYDIRDCTLINVQEAFRLGGKGALEA